MVKPNKLRQMMVSVANHLNDSSTLEGMKKNGWIYYDHDLKSMVHCSGSNFIEVSYGVISIKGYIPCGGSSMKKAIKFLKRCRMHRPTYLRRDRAIRFTEGFFE